MNNYVFGKTMENLRKRVNIKLVTDKKALDKLTSKPTFKSLKIFNENLVAVDLIQEKLFLDKPVYVGMSILELSKTLMYDFHYNFIKNDIQRQSKIIIYGYGQFMLSYYRAYYKKKGYTENIYETFNWH